MRSRAVTSACSSVWRSWRGGLGAHMVDLPGGAGGGDGGDDVSGVLVEALSSSMAAVAPRVVWPVMSAMSRAS